MRVYTFFWQGKGSDKTGEYGVGFTVKNSLLKMTEHIFSLQLYTSDGPIILVSVYAPIFYFSQKRSTMPRFQAISALMPTRANTQTKWWSSPNHCRTHQKGMLCRDETLSGTLFTALHSRLLGKKWDKTQDWSEVNSSQLTTVIKAKCVVLLDHKCHPTQATLQLLRKTRSRAQKTARGCVND